MAFIKAGPPLHHYRGAGKQLRRSLLLVPLLRGGRLRHEGLLLTSRESCGRTQMSREGFSFFFLLLYTLLNSSSRPRHVRRACYTQSGRYRGRPWHRGSACEHTPHTCERVSTHRTRARGWAHTQVEVCCSSNNNYDNERNRPWLSIISWALG